MKLNHFGRWRVGLYMRLLLPILIVISAAAPRLSSAQTTNDVAYPLDTMSRTIAPTGKMRCPKVPMRRYKGSHLRYHKPVYIYVNFEAHLQRFEAVVARVAMEVYGRTPSRIVHVGTYNCRRIRRYPELLSEHGIGNAIDVEGFDFSRARTKDEIAANDQRRLRRGFKVRVGKHWNKTRGVSKKHARFLRLLTEQLIEEDVFRVLLGPAFPGHQDHFHFDVAPYRLVQL